MTADGQFLEVMPDSMETDSVRKARPTFKSAAGRTLYGGGAITPDVIVPPDTLTTPEQQLRRQLAPNIQKYLNAVSAVAESQKGKVTPTFTMNAAWRDQVWQKLVADTVKIDKAVWDAGATDVDRYIEERVAKVAFGDTLVRRRSLKDDNQLRRAMELMKKSATQKDLFAQAGTAMPVAKAPAKKSGN